MTDGVHLGVVTVVTVSWGSDMSVDMAVTNNLHQGSYKGFVPQDCLPYHSTIYLKSHSKCVSPQIEAKRWVDTSGKTAEVPEKR